MSHWQTGKLDLKCSINILKKALINVMPDWEKHIKIDETGGLNVKFHGKNVEQTYQVVISGAIGLHSDIGFFQNKAGIWECGGDYSVDKLQGKLTGEVMRMRAIAIAQLRGYDVIRNEDTGNEIITEIRVDSDYAKELL